MKTIFTSNKTIFSIFRSVDRLVLFLSMMNGSTICADDKKQNSDILINEKCLYGMLLFMKHLNMNHLHSFFIHSCLF